MFGLVALVLAAPAVSPDPRHLAVPPAAAARARALVGLLGSPRFPEREEAQKELAGMGRLAAAALSDAAATSPDPEVRSRCGRLLPAAAAADRDARVAAFLADAAGEFDHDVPGWARFKAAAGTDPAARGLYAEAVRERANVALLDALDGPPADLGKMAAARCRELTFGRHPRPGTPAREPTPADVAVVLVAEAGGPRATAPRGLPMTSLVSVVWVAKALPADHPRRPAFERVLAHWADSRTDAAGAYQAYGLAERVGAGPPAKYAARLLTTPGVATHQKAVAAMNVARLGGRAYLSALEAGMADEGFVVRGGGVGGAVREIRVGDVALAAALLLTGQEPKEYGFRENAAGGATGRFTFTRFDVPPGDRDAAFAKWKAWRAKNPDPPAAGGP